MNKKIYIKPVCEVAEFEIQDSLLLNCSIGVDNTPQDGIEGRTNMNQGLPIYGVTSINTLVHF